MHHTLANLEGAAADLQTFALDSQDQTAKKMFNDLNRQLEGIVQTLKGRVNYVEKQEPQYKMNQNL
jgi:hypothetical protein